MVRAESGAPATVSIVGCYFQARDASRWFQTCGQLIKSRRAPNPFECARARTFENVPDQTI